MTPLYIFDIDGTLANCEHRVGLLTTEEADRWDRFYELCDRDLPIWAVVETLRMLESHADIWLFTGRRESTRAKTLNWLKEHYIPFSGVLNMRPDGSHAPDYKLKRDWYKAMSDDDRRRLVAVFEDRDRVVQMWRGLGVVCFQTTPGAF